MNHLFFAILGILSGVVHAASPGGDRPNVLLVITDDQGYGDAGFNGNPILKTPNLDALAASGVSFTDFLASPTCSPSRATLMTGRHEFRSGVTHTIEGRNVLRDGVPTMAEAFRKAGYRTGIFGKWHLGEPRPFHPLDRGFEHALLVGGGAVGQTPDFWGNTMFDPHLQENGGWKPYKGYMTDILADEALAWIRRDREPWFCYLALNAPHEPLQVGEEWAKPYLDAGLPPRLAKFYGMIANLDAQLGRLLAGLDSDGLARRTVVVFLGDNGTALGGDPQPGEFNAGLRGTKGSAYQGGARIPAVFSWPGHFPEDRRVSTLAGLCDVFPTLAALCGLDVRAFPEMDGRSLEPILLAGRQPEGWSDRALPVHVARWPANTPVDKLPFLNSSIRTQRHSLVNGSELYDLEADPGEERDIAALRPDVVERLRKEYLGWWNGVKDSAMETQPFVLGRPGTGPVELTCMDWSPGRTSRQPLPVGLWEQKTIAAWTSGKEMSGVDGGAGGWMVRVETPGTYMIELRRRPAGAAEPAPYLNGEAVMEVGGKTFRKPVPEGAEAVEFRVGLPAGEFFLEPLMFGQRASGLPEGAYFCRIEPAGP